MEPQVEMDTISKDSEPVNGYYPLPQPNDLTKREKQDAMGSYLMMFASMAVGLPLPFVNIIAALVYHHLNKKKSRFTHFHSFQSVCTQVVTGVLNSVAIVWFWVKFMNNHQDWRVYIGFAVMVTVINLVYITFSLIAASKANRGQFFYFLFFGKWAYHAAFAVKATDDASSEIVNKPPV